MENLCNLPMSTKIVVENDVRVDVVSLEMGGDEVGLGIVENDVALEIDKVPFNLILNCVNLCLSVFQHFLIL